MVNRELLRVLRPLSSEFSLPFSSLPNISDITPAAITNSPSVQLDGAFPIELFQGCEPGHPSLSLMNAAITE